MAVPIVYTAIASTPNSAPSESQPRGEGSVTVAITSFLSDDATDCAMAGEGCSAMLCCALFCSVRLPRCQGSSVRQFRAHSPCRHLCHCQYVPDCPWTKMMQRHTENLMKKIEEKKAK